MKLRALFSPLGITVAVLTSYAALQNCSEIQAALVATYMQVALYYNCLGPLSLFVPGFSSPSKSLRTPDLDMGHLNLLKLQFIYVLRYVFRDQFLLKSSADTVLKDIELRLTEQFSRNDWTLDTFSELPVPTHPWNETSPDEIFRDYVVNGVPVIIKGFPSEAKGLWNPSYFETLAGEHELDVINTSAVSSVRMKMSQYVASQSDPNGHDILYIRAWSEIFDVEKNLAAEVGYQAFNDHLKSRFLTAQIFMGMKKSAGTSYHCANFNNLFFQIQGRKRWTFVDSRYNALMYPMFNPKSMDVASFLTSIAINDTEIMTRYFPLYKFAPKMVATLEPGDVLFNPPWQWHQIENLEDLSVGVATRWFLGSQLYQNSVHSTLQFLSPYIWNNYYTKAYNLQKGIRSHKASNTVPVDERFNFGLEGSAIKFRPRIFPQAIYSGDSE